jgi:hypothetical protein
MANIIRIRKLENEKNLKNVVIPVDKDSYTSDCKYITILDLKAFVISGYTGTETYSHSGQPNYSVGGLLRENFLSGFTNVPVKQMFDLMLYPTTTTTTTLSPTTTTTTLSPTTTTTTLPPTTTTTLPPTTTTTLPPTTTTTLPPTTTTTTTLETIIYVNNTSSDVVVGSVSINGVYVGGTYPLEPLNSTQGITVQYGIHNIVVDYTYTTSNQSVLIINGSFPYCQNVADGSPFGPQTNIIQGQNITINVSDAVCA